MISDVTTYTTTATLLTPDTNTTITTTTIHDDGRTTVGAVVVAGRVAAVEDAEEHEAFTDDAEGERSEAMSDRRTDTGPLMDYCFGPIPSAQRVIDLTRLPTKFINHT